MRLEQAPRAMVVLVHFSEPRHPGFTSSGSRSWAQAISGMGGRAGFGTPLSPYSCSCPCDAFQSPMGKSQPENYLSWPGSGEEGSGMGRPAGASAAFLPLRSPMSAAHSPTPRPPQKHTLITPTPTLCLCFDSSLDPEAAMDTLFIVSLTKGLE